MADYPNYIGTSSFYNGTLGDEEISSLMTVPAPGGAAIGDGVLIVYTGNTSLLNIVSRSGLAIPVKIADTNSFQVYWTTTTASSSTFRLEHDDFGEATYALRIFRFSTSVAGSALVKNASSISTGTGTAVTLAGQTAVADYSLAIAGTVTRAINTVSGYGGVNGYTEKYDSSNSTNQNCSISIGVSADLDTSDASSNDGVTLSTSTAFLGFSLVVGVVGASSSRRVCIIG